MDHSKPEDIIENMKEQDISQKHIPYWGGELSIYYIRQLVDTEALSEYILKPITQYIKNTKEALSAQKVQENIIITENNTVDDDLSKVEQYILNGYLLLFFSNNRHYIAVNLKKPAKRSISDPEFRYTYRGPREAFVEDLDTNLSLVRKYLKDKELRIEKTKLGKRTQTDVAILYINDIANPVCVSEIIKRIEKINIDAIIETGELENYLLNNRHNLMPQMGVLEKPDQAVEKLLEGKVIIFVDGGCVAISAPKTFIEFFYSEDDRYENRFFGLFMRIIRYIAFFISVTFTSFYIGLSMYHPDVMPASYIVTFAQMRSRAPFSPFIAVLILEFIVELVREALLRVPKKIGSAIAIVGAIIIGQAASTAGIFTPLLLIIVSIGFLASFTLPDFALMNAFRILKFLLVILTGTFGFYGFSLGFMFILINLVSINSFGVPYFSPFAPYNGYDFARVFIFDRRSSPKRQQYMRNIDDTRTNEKNISKHKRRAVRK